MDRALDFIKRKPRTAAELADAMRVSRATAYKYARLLRAGGKIKDSGHRRPADRGPEPIIWEAA